MKLVFIRHGEPDYGDVTDRGFIGHGRDLAALTQAGKAQAEAAAGDPRLDGVELLVSSPYTRALETAAIISRVRQVPITVETDVHEWLPDVSFTYCDTETSVASSKACYQNQGLCPPDRAVQYETLESVFRRGYACLKRYLPYRKVAVVTHGIFIRQFVYAPHIPYCSLSEIEFTEDFKWSGFIDEDDVLTKQ